MSSAESEYVSACTAAMAAAVVRSLLYDIRYLGTAQHETFESSIKFPPTILCVDNAAAVAMSRTPKLTKKTRRIARYFHFVRHGVKHGLHKLYWITKDIQLADPMTKTQVAAKSAPMIAVFMYQLPPFLSSRTISTTSSDRDNHLVNVNKTHTDHTDHQPSSDRQPLHPSPCLSPPSILPSESLSTVQPPQSQEGVLESDYSEIASPVLLGDYRYVYHLPAHGVANGCSPTSHKTQRA
jgi:hypothetical protein